MRSGLRIAVGIATAGRPLILAETLVELASQTRLPSHFLFVRRRTTDFDASQASQLPFPVHVVKGSRGLPAQRNAIIDAALDFDILMFFDDDFVPAPYLSCRSRKLFRGACLGCGGDWPPPRRWHHWAGH